MIKVAKKQYHDDDNLKYLMKWFASCIYYLWLELQLCYFQKFGCYITDTKRLTSRIILSREAFGTVPRKVITHTE